MKRMLALAVGGLGLGAVAMADVVIPVSGIITTQKEAVAVSWNAAFQYNNVFKWNSSSGMVMNPAGAEHFIAKCAQGGCPNYTNGYVDKTLSISKSNFNAGKKYRVKVKQRAHVKSANVFGTHGGRLQLNLFPNPGSPNDYKVSKETLSAQPNAESTLEVLAELELTPAAVSFAQNITANIQVEGREVSFEPMEVQILEEGTGF